MDSELMFVPLILFMIFVAPIWVIMHYKTLGKKQGGLTQEEHERLGQLDAMADKMEQRISTLESILDEETPDWRKRYEQ